MSKKVGIVLNAVTHEILRVAFPSRELELGYKDFMQSGEEVLIVDAGVVSTAESLDRHIRVQFSLPEPPNDPPVVAVLGMGIGR